jgi:hypothetical protein
MDIQKMIDDYTNWLKSEITVARFGEYYELTTPYLDRFNDYFQIYVKQELGGSMTITDDGYVINNLISSGMKFKSGTKRKIMLDRIIKNFSLRLDGNAIVATATASNFPQKKHQMVQAMLYIDDMFELSSENVKDFFIEDIETFFNSNDIFFTLDFSLLGKTGSIYTYDFHFQRTRNQSERFCRALNKVNESNRNMTIFNWIDTQEKRNHEGELIAILNDENLIDAAHIDALESYDIKSVLFSKRQENLGLFRAA